VGKPGTLEAMRTQDFRRRLAAMTPERYQRIQLLADIALKLDPDLRRAYLDEQCVGDVALRRDVERLLAADDRTDSFLEKPAIEKFAGILASDQPQGGKQPMILNGRYRIEDMDKDKLGEGGFGVVYQARDLRLQREARSRQTPSPGHQEQRLLEDPLLPRDGGARGASRPRTSSPFSTRERRRTAIPSS
jgi:hypothetical protein